MQQLFRTETNKRFFQKGGTSLSELYSQCTVIIKSRLAFVIILLFYVIPFTFSIHKALPYCLYQSWTDPTIPSLVHHWLDEKNNERSWKGTLISFEPAGQIVFWNQEIPSSYKNNEVTFDLFLEIFIKNTITFPLAPSLGWFKSLKCASFLLICHH